MSDALHKLLILSRRAVEYCRIIEGAELPDLEIRSASDPHVGLSSALECDLALGEPSLLRQALPAMPALRWVQATWAGVEPLLDAAMRRDYVLTNARVFGPQMSEYIFGYILAHERLILQKYASQQAGRWDATPPGTLRGKRLGLLGVGSVGAALARTGKHFGMRVKGLPRASERCPDVDAYLHAKDLVAFAADLGSLVSPLPNPPATRKLVDAALLRALPPHAVFLNPGRGSAVDEDALAAALKEGRLAGAGLDGFAEEPPPAPHPFLRAPHT